MKGWSVALRIAWRDFRRHKARNALVLTLIALPVLLVSSGAIVAMTAQVRGVEALDGKLGAAQASMTNDGAGKVTQMPDPDDGSDWVESSNRRATRPGRAELVQVLGDDAAPVPLVRSWTEAVQPDGDLVYMEVREGDFTDPLLAGLVEVLDGRLPEAPHEVAVTEDLRAAGYPIGSTLPAAGIAEPPTVVGVVEDAVVLQGELAFGSPGSLLEDPDSTLTQWYVGGDPVTWEDVLALNEVGFVVVSRAVVTDPPPDDEIVHETWSSPSENAESLAVAAMIVAMVLIEIVLLAGPAFAVTARNHTRTLALVAASGGTPRQGRRVILAGALVLGLVATVTGTLLSLPLAYAALPLVQRFSSDRLGPFDVPWPWLLVIATFGLLSALLAAVVPAWLTSRQDVVAALAGRRSDGAPSLRTPVAGAVVLGGGVAATAYGAFNYEDFGPLLMSGGAVVSMLGMILVVPALVAVVARSADDLPLAMRYAVRDAARHRTRTVPAIAAVAATVAGVVALGIANASDEKETEETYTAMAPMGTGMVIRELSAAGDDSQTWDDVEAAARRAAPDVEMRQAQGLRAGTSGTVETYWSVEATNAGEETWLLSETGGFYSSSVLVDDAPFLDLSQETRIALERVLADGKVAVFTDQGAELDEVELSKNSYDFTGGDGAVESSRQLRLPAETVPVEGSVEVAAVVPTALADRLGKDVETVGLVLTSDIDRETEKAIERAVRGVDRKSVVTVERGYERDPYALVVLWVLGVVGALLMLAGTLTATFLSLSDARPDLATVSAVGGAPRMRRAVAASYALMIAALGAVLGAVVGFVPGIAVSLPLTTYGSGSSDVVGPFLAIPWLLIVAVVVLLPLFSAAVVWLSARSRLPMVARID